MSYIRPNPHTMCRCATPDDACASAQPTPAADVAKLIIEYRAAKKKVDDELGALIALEESIKKLVRAKNEERNNIERAARDFLSAAGLPISSWY